MSRAANTGSTSTTAAVASVQQVASVIAQHKGELNRLLANDDACNLAFLGAVDDKAFTNSDAPSPRTVTQAILCTAIVHPLVTASESLVSDLAALEPPQEVAALTKDTLTTARSLSREASTLGKCLPTVPTSNDAIGQCTNIQLFTDAARALLSKLAGWSPYGAG